MEYDLVCSMKRYTTLLLVLAVSSAVKAFTDFVPRGKVLTYNYKGEISAETQIPNRYASQLFVYAKLHVQLEGYGIVGQLSDVNYKVYNGKAYYGYKYDLHNLPLPDEAKDLTRPFKIAYNSNGQLKSLSMEKDEKMFARNMHRAIAALLQMDCKKVNLNSNISHAFTTTEQNLYGKSITEYNVFTKDDILVVQKFHEMTTTEPIYAQASSNIDFDYCEAHFEDPVFHESQQRYDIKKKDSNYVADYIETTGTFRMRPFHARSEDYTVYTKITLDLDEVSPITSTRSRKSEQTEYDIYYRVYDTTDKEKIDFTNGRKFIDLDKYVSKAEEILCQMGIFLHDPLNEKDASVNNAIVLLEYFDIKALEKLYERLQEKSPYACEIFHQILPYVGTHASTIFIKNIISENKVKDYEAIQMLADLPGFVRNPTEELLKDVEVMMNWDDKVKDPVRRSGILCFTALMYQTYKNQNKPQGGGDHTTDTSDEYKHVTYNVNGHKQYNSFSERVKSFFKKKSIFQIYTEKLSKMIYDGDTIHDKILGIQGLFNTKSPAILDTFLPIIKGEKPASVMMRVWTIWMTAHVIIGNSDYIYELYWPVMTNHNEPMEVRVVSYYVLVECHPTLTRLLNLQHTLEKDRDSELYYFHYKHMAAMSRSTDPCHQVTHLNFKQIYKDAPEPTYYGTSNYYQSDYMNLKYKYGEDINYAYLASKSAGMFKWEYNVQSDSRRFNAYTIYGRIEGLDSYALQDVRVALNSTEGLINYQGLINIFQSKCHKDVVIYLDRSTNKRITHSMVLKCSDFSNMDLVWEILRTIGFTYFDNRIEVRMLEKTIIPFPTEIGMPVILEGIAPSINRYTVNVKKGESDNSVTHFDNHYYFSNRFRYGLTFYNSLADIWQGVGKMHSIQYQFPFYADLTINRQQRNLKLSLKKYEKEYKDAIALNLDINRQTFIKGDKEECLEKSCPECKRSVRTVTDANLRNKEIKSKVELDPYLMEYNYESDRYVSDNILDEWADIWSNNDKKNVEGIYDYFRMTYLDWYRSVILQPRPVSTKLSIVLTPSAMYKSTQTDINARFKETVTQEENQFLPGVKYNFRISTSVKNKENVLKTWDVQFNRELNCGHTSQYTKLDVTRTVPNEKEYKFCYEDTKEWSLSEVKGNSTITVNVPNNDTPDEYDITYIGKQLAEQKSPHHGYGVCLPYVHTGSVDTSSVQCLAEHNSLRYYNYKIKAKNNLNSFEQFLSAITNFYNVGCLTESVEDANISVKDMQLTMIYPTNGKGVDLTYQLHDRLYTYKNIPNYLTSPGNTHSSKLYTFLRNNGFMKRCQADVNVIKIGLSNEEPLECKLEDNWNTYVGDVDCKHGVFLKRIKGTNLMAFKTSHEDQSLEIYPCGDNYEKFKFMLNGEELTNDLDFYSCDWFTYLYRQDNHEVIINNLDFHLNIRYTGNSITIEIPNVDGFKFYGKCFM